MEATSSSTAANGAQRATSTDAPTTSDTVTLCAVNEASGPPYPASKRAAAVITTAARAYGAGPVRWRFTGSMYAARWSRPLLHRHDADSYCRRIPGPCGPPRGITGDGLGVGSADRAVVPSVL